MGASGALEFLATALALQAGTLPANAGTTQVDPALKLNGVLLQNRAVDAGLALSNSFAFGGLNAVLALRRYPSVA